MVQSFLKNFIIIITLLISFIAEEVFADPAKSPAPQETAVQSAAPKSPSVVPTNTPIPQPTSTSAPTAAPNGTTPPAKPTPTEQPTKSPTNTFTATPTKPCTTEPYTKQCFGKKTHSKDWRCCMEDQCKVDSKSGIPYCADLCDECSSNKSKASCCGKNPSCIPENHDCCLDTSLEFSTSCKFPSFCCGSATTDNPLCYRHGTDQCCVTKASDETPAKASKCTKGKKCCYNSEGTEVSCISASAVCCGEASTPFSCTQAKPKCCTNHQGKGFCCKSNQKCDSEEGKCIS